MIRGSPDVCLRALCIMTSLSGEALPVQCIVQFVTRQNVVVPPLSHVKRPEFCGCLARSGLSQTGYITRRTSDYNFREYNQTIRIRHQRALQLSVLISGYTILFKRSTIHVI